MPLHPLKMRHKVDVIVKFPAARSHARGHFLVWLAAGRLLSIENRTDRLNPRERLFMGIDMLPDGDGERQ